MEKFGDKLRQYIEEAGYSIREFAQKCDFDRPWLNNIINGKKRIPKNKFEQILNSGIFSQEKMVKLKYIYYQNQYSENQFEKIKYILSRFESTAPAYDISTPMAEEKAVYSGETEVLSALKHVLQKEKSFFYLYTNLPADGAKITGVLYNQIKDKPVRDYKHIMYAGMSNTPYNINTYFTIAKFAEIGYGINLVENVNVSQLKKFNAFPFYLMVNNILLLFSSDLKALIISTDMDKVALYQKEFMALYKTSKNPTRFYDDILKIRNDSLQMYFKAVRMDISKTLRVSTLLTHEIIMNNINPVIPNASELSHAHIELFFGDKAADCSKLACFYTIESITKFANDGVVEEMPAFLLQPIKAEDRITILERIKKCIRGEGLYKIYIFDPQKLKYNFCTIDLENGGNVNMFGFRTNKPQNDNRFLYEWTCTIEDKIAYDDIINTMDFVVNNGLVYSDSFAGRLIDYLIAELKVSLRPYADTHKNYPPQS